MSKELANSELILNPDGTIYHLKIKDSHVANMVILVGDPGRVETVSSFFDKTEVKIENREFVTHTGYYKGKRITAISTGIGTDNIDIVLNELDAVMNIDLEKRCIKEKQKKLNIIRIGTTGGLQGELGVGSFVLSRVAAGFDGLIHFYRDGFTICDEKIEKAFVTHTEWFDKRPVPYFVHADKSLFKLLNHNVYSGITLSSPGFYGPQGRRLRLPVTDPELNDKMHSFSYDGMRITNYEMESSALFGLSSLLGHRSVSICAVIANRVTGEFVKDHKKVIRDLINFTLDQILEFPDEEPISL
ncbi:MAG: nucleoside phosphorylase [Bacteroidota bacterium]